MTARIKYHGGSAILRTVILTPKLALQGDFEVRFDSKALLFGQISLDPMAPMALGSTVRPCRGSRTGDGRCVRAGLLRADSASNLVREGPLMAWPGYFCISNTPVTVATRLVVFIGFAHR
jgi:hypothetical protein